MVAKSIDATRRREARETQAHRDRQRRGPLGGSTPSKPAKTGDAKERESKLEALSAEPIKLSKTTGAVAPLQME